MNAIVTKIKALRPVRACVDFVEGTNMIPVVFEYEDFEVPAGATATVVIQTDTAETYQCTVEANAIQFKPSFSASGVFKGQVKLLSSTERTLHSFPVTFNVYPFCGK